MFGRKLKLFRVFGFSVHVDVSWIVIALMVTWSLAEGFFPFEYRTLSAQTYWIMGVAGALGLFGSVVFHELSHSLVARRYGLQMRGITLFIFGGVAEMDEEPASPKVEFLMALAGPLSSLLLSGLFYGVYVFGQRSGWGAPIYGVFGYLGVINAILAGFNLVPAFPLDGGRVLRSILWGWRKDLLWGTRISAAIGSGFGIFLVLYGVASILQGNFIGGVWQFLIGIFVRDAAKSAYQQLLTRQVLEGESVRRFMQPNPVTVNPSVTLSQLVDGYIYQHQHKMFPVVNGSELVGCVELNQVKEIPRNEWPRRTVGEIAKPCSFDQAISPDADAVTALAKMNQSHTSRLLVMDRGRLIGTLSLRDLVRFLSLKEELEKDGRAAA
ncbi:MAG: site-2 protease family protein [Nitrospirae bacterium]|nr:site-2 protease family protein [Candidatus Manganitrophaceae bacterium]